MGVFIAWLMFNSGNKTHVYVLIEKGLENYKHVETLCNIYYVCLTEVLSLAGMDSLPHIHQFI